MAVPSKSNTFGGMIGTHPSLDGRGRRGPIIVVMLAAVLTPSGLPAAAPPTPPGAGGSTDAPAPEPTAVLRVGKGKQFATPGQAAAAAVDGALVEIDAGTYAGDVAVWRADDLTIRGVGAENGGRAHLRADGKDAGGKGIWVVAGDRTTVENIEFSGAAVPDQNGAGIRLEGAGLTVRNCYFHDNENGILGGHPDGDLLVERSEFARNGHGDGQSHNLYVGGRSFTLRFCNVHHAKVGHNVKSRALKNLILYNRITDEKDGTGSCNIDLPNGGASYVIGNLIQQGPETENSALISYAAEGAKNPSQELYLVNNTLANDRARGGTFVDVKGGRSTVRLVNNIFAGGGTVLAGAEGQQANNVVSDGDPGFVDRDRFDYRLTKGSAAINAGAAAGTAGDVELTPRFEYAHPSGGQGRPTEGAIDAGAYEFKAE